MQALVDHMRPKISGLSSNLMKGHLVTPWFVAIQSPEVPTHLVLLRNAASAGNLKLVQNILFFCVTSLTS
jgi:hypothetical protein